MAGSQKLLSREDSHRTVSASAVRQSVSGQSWTRASAAAHVSKEGEAMRRSGVRLGRPAGPAHHSSLVQQGAPLQRRGRHEQRLSPCLCCKLSSCFVAESLSRLLSANSLHPRANLGTYLVPRPHLFSYIALCVQHIYRLCLLDAMLYKVDSTWLI